MGSERTALRATWLGQRQLASNGRKNFNDANDDLFPRYVSTGLARITSRSKMIA
jgi:hypothetical protein